MSGDKHKTGVILVNLGSPDAPTRRAVRRYLKQFLSDPRVVNLPRFLWWLILHFIVLPLRPGKAAKAYRKIWTPNGSPLIHITRQLSDKLARHIAPRSIKLDFAMRYGKPSMARKLSELHHSGIEKLIVLPLYPQYSSTTTASVYDEMVRITQGWRHIPSISFISDYHQHPAYIQAVAQSIQRHWQKHGQSQLLILSFHGLPAKLTELGDPYYHQCQTSATLIAQALGLEDHQWQLVFQSRFGKTEWLKPYCVEVLRTLPQQGVTSVDVVCPGFAVDCLETLEEIAMENKTVFMQAGGQSYRYIPALNDDSLHIKCLTDILEGENARL